MRFGNPLVISLTFLLGLALGWVTGNCILVLPVSLAVTFLWLWRRQLRHAERRQAQQFAVYRALAEQAIRGGEVRACPSCHRPMLASARRCVYCGRYRGDGPLR